MKYFLDTEFLEGKQSKKILNFNIGKTKPTIDLISVGIVSEDGREYYAISKDFNLKEAWNRFEYAKQTMFEKQNGYKGRKVYWIRENVLKPIFQELTLKEAYENNDLGYTNMFNFKHLERLIKKYGHSNRHIANEICQYIYGGSYDLSGLSPLQLAQQFEISDKSKEPEFYTYYGAYDWVVFCWLFGKMIDLPKGFPMYSRDLKQILDEKQHLNNIQEGIPKYKENLKQHPTYPKQENEHDALADAKWNKKLYEFLIKN